MVPGAAAEHRPLLPAGTGATRPALSVAEVLLTLHGVEVTRGVELEVVELHVAWLGVGVGVGVGVGGRVEVRVGVRVKVGVRVGVRGKGRVRVRVRVR